MIDPHDRLADEEQVVRLVDAARLRIVERHEPRGDAPHLDGFEHLADRRERLPLRIGEERERALLRIRTRLALVRDDVHRRSLRRVRLANRQRPRRTPYTRASQRLKVSTSNASADAMEEANKRVEPLIKEMRGLQRAVDLADRSSGKMLSIALFDS